MAQVSVMNNTSGENKAILEKYKLKIIVIVQVIWYGIETAEFIEQTRWVIINSFSYTKLLLFLFDCEFGEYCYVAFQNDQFKGSLF